MAAAAFAVAVVAIGIFCGSASGPDIAIDGDIISGEEFLECMESVKYDTKIQIQKAVSYTHLDSREPVIWGDRGKKFSVYISITETDGKVEEECGYLSVSGVKNITVVLTAVNNPVITDTYEKLRKMHQEDYKNLYGRTELYLGEQPNIPTDVRLRNLREGQQDNALYALYFQYGRYLMISSSRGEDSLPATLQGIWCWEMQPPWSSNWTTNINTQMLSLIHILLVKAMTNGGPDGASNVFLSYMYQEAYTNSSYGYGMAIGGMVFMFSFILAAVLNAATKRPEVEF